MALDVLGIPGTEIEPEKNMVSRAMNSVSRRVKNLLKSTAEDGVNLGVLSGAVGLTAGAVAAVLSGGTSIVPTALAMGAFSAKAGGIAGGLVGAGKSLWRGLTGKKSDK